LKDLYALRELVSSIPPKDRERAEIVIDRLDAAIRAINKEMDKYTV